MFGRGIRLPFRLLGIPLILDWSFLLILPLLAWIIGSRVEALARMFGLPDPERLGQGWTPWAIGLIAAVGLFLGVVLHELGHAVTARLYGVRVRSITLWFLGGVAAFEDMPRQPGAEAIVAIVGPVVSFVLAGLCWLGAALMPEGAPAARFILQYLAILNAVIGVFNLLPALPLDGGRVLRSLLALWLPHGRATQIAGGVSRVLALLLGLVGLLSFNFFLLLIAIFIFLAVSAETATTRVETLLRDASVRHLMNRDVKTVPPDLTVADLIQAMLRERRLGFPVVDERGHVLGMVTIEQAHGRDPAAPVSAIMSREVPTIAEEADAEEAFRLMSRNGFGRVIVTDQAGRMAGIITKTDLMRLIQIRSVSPDAIIAAPDPAHWPPGLRGPTPSRA